MRERGDDRQSRVSDGLDLLFAGMTIVQADDFGGLTTLNLSFNRLRIVPPGVFAELTRMEPLWLPGNQLLELPGGVFASLPARRSKPRPFSISR